MSIITRTIFNTVADVVKYYPEADSVSHIDVTIPLEKLDNSDKADCKRILGFASSYCAFGEFPFYVSSVSHDSALYGLEESVFISHAKQAETRNPETRGCITKEVHAFVADCLVFDDATKSVEMRVFPLPGKLDADKAKTRLNRAAKGYTVVNVKEVREIIGLYYMPVADFVKLASVIEK